MHACVHLHLCPRLRQRRSLCLRACARVLIRAPASTEKGPCHTGSQNGLEGGVERGRDLGARELRVAEAQKRALRGAAGLPPAHGGGRATTAGATPTPTSDPRALRTPSGPRRCALRSQDSKTFSRLQVPVRHSNLCQFDKRGYHRNASTCALLRQPYC